MQFLVRVSEHLPAELQNYHEGAGNTLLKAGSRAVIFCVMSENSANKG